MLLCKFAHHHQAASPTLRMITRQLSLCCLYTIVYVSIHPFYAPSYNILMIL